MDINDVGDGNDVEVMVVMMTMMVMMVMMVMVIITIGCQCMETKEMQALENDYASAEADEGLVVQPAANATVMVMEKTTKRMMNSSWRRFKVGDHLFTADHGGEGDGDLQGPEDGGASLEGPEKALDAPSWGGSFESHPPSSHLSSSPIEASPSPPNLSLHSLKAKNSDQTQLFINPSRGRGGLEGL